MDLREEGMLFMLKKLIPSDKLCLLPTISPAIYEGQVARMC